MASGSAKLNAKLVDNDPVRFDRPTLESWKRAAEREAAVALAHHSTSAASSTARKGFAKAEKLMPALLEEFREDLRNNPTSREFIVLKRSWVYNASGPYLVYYFDDHENVEGKLQVLMNLNLIREITYNNTRRFVFQEQFVDYLTSD